MERPRGRAGSRRTVWQGAALAALVALVERSCTQLIALVARSGKRVALRSAAQSFPAARPLLVRRRNPLAELRGLRAPPLPV